MKLKYFHSNFFNNYMYECTKCGLDTLAYKMEGIAGTNCKSCGTIFDKSDIEEAKKHYIEIADKK